MSVAPQRKERKKRFPNVPSNPSTTNLPGLASGMPGSADATSSSSASLAPDGTPLVGTGLPTASSSVNLCSGGAHLQGKLEVFSVRIHDDDLSEERYLHNLQDFSTPTGSPSVPAQQAPPYVLLELFEIENTNRAEVIAGGWSRAVRSRAQILGPDQTAIALPKRCVSIHRKLSKNIPSGRVGVRSMTHQELVARHGAAFIELSFSNYFISRSDMYTISHSLHNRDLVLGETIRYDGVQLEVNAFRMHPSPPPAGGGSGLDTPSPSPSPTMQSPNRRQSTSGFGASLSSPVPPTSNSKAGQGCRSTAASAAYVTPATKVCFQSRSFLTVWLIHLSEELWVQTSDGRIRLDWLIDGFISELVSQYQARKVLPTVKVFFFGRINAEAHNLPPDGVYDILTRGASAKNDAQLRELPREIRRQVAIVIASVRGRIHLPSAPQHTLFAPAAKSNFLEAIITALDRFTRHHVDRRLNLSGHSLVVIGAGKGNFRVSNRLSQVAAMKMLDHGVKQCSLICIGRPPLHVTPLLEYEGSDPALVGQPGVELHRQRLYYEQPKWVTVMFYHPALATPNPGSTPKFRLWSRDQWNQEMMGRCAPGLAAPPASGDIDVGCGLKTTQRQHSPTWRPAATGGGGGGGSSCTPSNRHRRGPLQVHPTRGSVQPERWFSRSLPHSSGAGAGLLSTGNSLATEEGGGGSSCGGGRMPVDLVTVCWSLRDDAVSTAHHANVTSGSAHSSRRSFVGSGSPSFSHDISNAEPEVLAPPPGTTTGSSSGVGHHSPHLHPHHSQRMGTTILDCDLRAKNLFFHLTLHHRRAQSGFRAPSDPYGSAVHTIVLTGSSSGVGRSVGSADTASPSAVSARLGWNEELLSDPALWDIFLDGFGTASELDTTCFYTSFGAHPSATSYSTRGSGLMSSRSFADATSPVNIASSNASTAVGSDGGLVPISPAFRSLFLQRNASIDPISDTLTIRINPLSMQTVKEVERTPVYLRLADDALLRTLFRNYIAVNDEEPLSMGYNMEPLRVALIVPQHSYAFALQPINPRVGDTRVAQPLQHRVDALTSQEALQARWCFAFPRDEGASADTLWEEVCLCPLLPLTCRDFFSKTTSEDAYDVHPPYNVNAAAPWTPESLLTELLLQRLHSQYQIVEGTQTATSVTITISHQHQELTLDSDYPGMVRVVRKCYRGVYNRLNEALTGGWDYFLTRNYLTSDLEERMVQYRPHISGKNDLPWSTYDIEVIAAKQFIQDTRFAFREVMFVLLPTLPPPPHLQPSPSAGSPPSVGGSEVATSFGGGSPSLGHSTTSNPSALARTAPAEGDSLSVTGSGSSGGGVEFPSGTDEAKYAEERQKTVEFLSTRFHKRFTADTEGSLFEQDDRALTFTSQPHYHSMPLNAFRLTQSTDFACTRDVHDAETGQLTKTSHRDREYMFFLARLSPFYNPMCAFSVRVTWWMCAGGLVADWVASFMHVAARRDIRVVPLPIELYPTNPLRIAHLSPCRDIDALRTVLLAAVSRGGYCPTESVLHCRSRLIHRSGCCMIVAAPPAPARRSTFARMFQHTTTTTTGSAGGTSSGGQPQQVASPQADPEQHVGGEPTSWMHQRGWEDHPHILWMENHEVEEGTYRQKQCFSAFMQLINSLDVTVGAAFAS